MNSSFKMIVLSLFLFPTYGGENKLPIEISGKTKPYQRKAILNVVQKDYPSLQRLIYWNPRNESCQINKQAILQICFSEKKSWIAKSEKKKIKGTLGRLIQLEEGRRSKETEKTKKALYNKEPKVGVNDAN